MSLATRHMDTPSSSEDKCLTLASSGLPEFQCQSSTGANHMALQCVGSLQVQCRLQLGFICGSLPVPTDNEAMMCGRSDAEAAIVPAISIQNEGIVAPQYRMLPNQTDLNTLFLSDVEHEQILPITSGRPPEGVNNLCKAWSQSYHNQPLARKCETLAVSALAGYEDQIDVIAPVELLKRIFKIPYSKARLSIAVHRVGQTLILNTGPDVEDGENLVRTKKNQAKAMEKALFLKFAMQSVRAEACDCPLQQNAEDRSTTNNASKSTTSGSSNGIDGGLLDPDAHASEWCYTMNERTNKIKINNESAKSLNASKGISQNEHKQRVSLSQSDQKSVSGIGQHKRSSMVGDHQRDPDCIPNEPGNNKRSNSDGFLRVLFWQLEEMKMLLGSDLLLFSNEKHVAVSLHLWEMERQVTPLMWLDAWLDNVMASVPELAICYHHNGIVQGYELLKTDDIFLLKGLSEDGTSFFHPHIIRQNALSVLRFLHENCKEDFGTYWLFKNGGEDLVQLFNLSVITNKRTATAKEEKNVPLPFSRGRGNGSCSLPLGILLYRLAHRLSLSKDPEDRSKCANFFRKCLELLGEQEHLFVRASAHEHVARLILKCHEELGSMLMPFMLEANGCSDGAPACLIEKMMKSSESLCLDTGQKKSNSASTSGNNHDNSAKGDLVSIPQQKHQYSNREKLELDEPIEKVTQMSVSDSDCMNDGATVHGYAFHEDTIVSNSSLTSVISHNIVMPVSARLAAVHHVSQAIKALRWQRQLQDVEVKVLGSEREVMGTTEYVHLVPVCASGELDRIEYYDIRECEFGPFMDRKLVQLVLLLGESYLALGQAYRDDGQLKWALKSVELACSVYESIPLHWKNNDFVSDEQSAHWVPIPTSYSSKVDMPMQLDDHSQTFCQPFLQAPFTQINADKDLFWGQAWILVGDIYVDYQRLNGNNLAKEEASKCNELTMAQDVIRELKRLKKKLNQNKKNCTVCSLVRCSCESDRASSGSNASSSSSPVATRKALKHHKKGSQSVENLENKNESMSGCVDQLLKHEISLQPTEENADMKKVRDTNLASEGVEDNQSEPEKKKEGDIFFFLTVPNNLNKEKSLQNAAACYDAAVLLLSTRLQGSEAMKTALKKKGWTYNEIGRMKLDSGNMKEARAMFDKAIGAFKDVNDQINVTLIYCNVGHSQRAAAEALVAELDSWKGDVLYEQILRKVFDDAVLQYKAALNSYQTAKMELQVSEVSKKDIGLRDEVLAQCARTYLRLGMLLAKEDKYGFQAINKYRECLVADSLAQQHRRINNSADSAIGQAMHLYEKLGSPLAQELAFTHFQLACYYRDCCFEMMKFEMRKLSDSAFQKPKRYLTLAESYWLKALKYYKPTSHPDMFLDILMEMSALNVAVSSSSGSPLMLDVALSHLLEARHVIFSEDKASDPPDNLEQNACVNPSERVVAMYSEQLCTLLKTMLTASQRMMHKSSSQKAQAARNLAFSETNSSTKGEGHKAAHGSSDIEKLKSMYRLVLLKSEKAPNVKRLYEVWIA